MSQRMREFAAKLQILIVSESCTVNLINKSSHTGPEQEQQPQTCMPKWIRERPGGLNHSQRTVSNAESSRNSLSQTGGYQGLTEFSALNIYSSNIQIKQTVFMYLEMQQAQTYTYVYAIINEKQVMKEIRSTYVEGI